MGGNPGAYQVKILPMEIFKSVISVKDSWNEEGKSTIIQLSQGCLPQNSENEAGRFGRRKICDNQFKSEIIQTFQLY